MENTNITGNEPYYPIIGINHQSTGITIRQKFIADYMQALAIKDPGLVCSPRKAEEAFQEYLKIINEPAP